MVLFPIIFDKLSFIFNRVDVYDDTTNLCKFQKDWSKNVDLIALKRKN